MKLHRYVTPGQEVWSLPARGAWIEINELRRERSERTVSLPARGAWIEITGQSRMDQGRRSLPARGAWIEILYVYRPGANVNVAPRKGGVD